MNINYTSTSRPYYNRRLNLQPLKNWFEEDIGKSSVYLVPIRIFIAIGWLRACAEKLMDSHWIGGGSLTKFFESELSGHQIAFPAYHWLVQSVFAPAAEPMSMIILVGQMLAGLALLFGIRTSFALMGGLFMNLNFLLAGRPEPNVFYLIIQMILLLGRAGDVASIDSLLKSLSWDFDESHLHPSIRLVLGLGSMLLSLAVAAYSFTHILHFDPASSVKDPAAVLCVFACMCAGLSLIVLLRQKWLGDYAVIGRGYRRPRRW